MRSAITAAQQLLKNRKEVIGVEVGVWKGGNAIHILKSWKEVKTLQVVDKYTVETAKKNFEGLGLENRIVWYALDSVIAASKFKDQSVDFVYIDACHFYPQVKLDIYAWLLKVKKGGILGGHDYDKNPKIDVVKSVDEFIKETGYKLYVESMSGSGWPAFGSTTDWWIYK